MAFPIFGEQNTPQIGMPVEANAEQVEDFPLEPVRAEPNRHKGIHDGILASQPDLQAHPVASGDGHQEVVQLEPRLNRVAVQASGVGQQVELQLGIRAATLRYGPKQISRHYDRGFAPEFNHLRNGLRAPRAQAFDNNISVLAGRLRHNAIPRAL
jgi:hypothetical protein